MSRWLLEVTNEKSGLTRRFTPAEFNARDMVLGYKPGIEVRWVEEPEEQSAEQSEGGRS